MADLTAKPPVLIGVYDTDASLHRRARVYGRL